MKKVYAYFLIDTNESGITSTWDECKNIVSGNHARYKSFKNIDEAKMWLNSGAEYEKKQKETKKKEKIESLVDGIYFDAGTGRGIGVEVRITDKDKISLIGMTNFYHNLGYEINEFDNINLGKGKTNNFGELLGLYLAIDIANFLGEKYIFGDSNLVLEYWSKGRANFANLEEETCVLIKKVAKARQEFEKKGGKIEYISGDFNPADLGFHK